jgi:predicted RNA binding protein YcfA (HicA-like mRNA interferase family)
MSKSRKILERVLLGFSDDHIAFRDLVSLMRALEFSEHVKGSHRIFSRNDIPEIVNLQPRGSQAKAYQVKQVRQIIQKYGLGESL